jgi:formylglycine-generating enzyme required for sulfatase activity
MGGDPVESHASAEMQVVGDMVIVPAGWFKMGSDSGEINERPEHDVFLDTFSIDRLEVSAGRFADFLNIVGNPEDLYFSYDRYSTITGASFADGRIIEGGNGHQWYVPKKGFENYPANNVSWFGANEYCKWKDKRLPTEAEWEKAARGADARTYPWGVDPPDTEKARFGRKWEEGMRNIITPVDSLARGASPFGLLNMAGNVWEWVDDYYKQNYCYYCSELALSEVFPEMFGGKTAGESPMLVSPRLKPSGPVSGRFKIMRGGSWYDSFGEYVTRTSYRNWFKPFQNYLHTGFRCAAPLPVEENGYRPGRAMNAALVSDGDIEITSVPVAFKDIYFDFDLSALTVESRREMDRVIEFVSANKDAGILVEGYCDERGPEEYNVMLALKRADAVRDKLLESGVDAKRIKTMSYGESMPVCIELFEDCWLKNRRVRIVVFVKTRSERIKRERGLLVTGSEARSVEDAEGVSPMPDSSKEGTVLSGQAAPAGSLRIIYPEEISEIKGSAEMLFKWEPVEGATRYRFVLSLDRNFESIMFESDQVYDTSAFVGYLDYGAYFFNVSAIDPDGRESATSGRHTFVVVPPPPVYGETKSLGVH